MASDIGPNGTCAEDGATADLCPAPPGKLRASIIIPHLNTPDLLSRALQSVAHQRIDHGRFEIIVVDNGSSISLNALKKAWPDVRFLVERTPGPGPARNLGIAHARADILAFIDADVEALPGWLQAGLDALEADSTGPVGGDVRIRVRDPARLTGVEAFESAFSFRQAEYIAKERYSVTANLMMTRAVFDRAGPFGGIETSEDILFGQRAYELGMPARYIPEMRALHPPRRDFEDMRRKWLRLSVQALSRHIGEQRSMAQWYLRAAVISASGVISTPRMLMSDRVIGLGNRLRGLCFLFRIRMARGLDMIRLAREAGAEAGTRAFNWNR